MIFEKVKDQMDRRAFAEFGEKELKEIVEEIATMYKAADFGEKIPNSYIELQNWVMDRIDNDFKYRSTGYVQEHFCIGVIWGAMLCAMIYSNGKE